MACFTVVRVRLDDDAITRKARKALGYAPVGEVLPGSVALAKARLTYRMPYTTADEVHNAAAAAVQREAKVLTAIAKVRRLQPTAIIKRKGDKLTVQVSV